MCLTPIMIDNPNYQSQVSDGTYHLLHDTVHQKIPVPCGRCSSCVHLRQIYITQRVQMESLNNDLFYGTLTYNQDSLPIAEYSDFSFAYPDFTDWQKMIKLIRKDFPDLKFKYMLVSEYGGKKKRPHFHFILSLPRTSDLLAEKWSKATELFDIFLRYWRRNIAPPIWSPKRQKFIANSRSPIWQPLCTYVRRGNKYNYDLHWLDPNSSKDGLDGVSFYVSKYLLKYDDWIDKFKSKLFYSLPHDQYKEAWDKFRPRILFSKFFGSPDDVDVRNHIIRGINFALNTSAFFPYFVSRVDGSTYPLSPYYSKRFLTVPQQLVFVSRRPDTTLSDSDVHDFDVQQENLSRVRSFLKSQSSSFDYDDISDINIQTFYDYANSSRLLGEAQDFATDWEDF